MPGREHGGRSPRVVSIETFDERGVTIVIDGDVDLDTAPQLDAAISQTVTDGHRHFVIDLSAATFLDSTAMRTLLYAINPLHGDPDAAVVLAGAHGIVERSLAVSGVGEMFTMFDTREAAISSLAGTSESLRHAWRDVRRRSEPSV